MRERDAILDLWRTAHGRGEACALATVCEVKGSAYRRPGARMLLTAGGQSAGIISGGCLDAGLWEQARAVMASGEARLLSYDTTSPGEIVWGLGLGCRGVVRILLEPARDLAWLADGNTVATFFSGAKLGSFPVDAPATEHPRVRELPGGRALVETMLPSQPLWIFGAGADAVPLAAMARSLGWEPVVVDLRPPRRGVVPLLPARHVSPEGLGDLVIDPRAACVVMTHNFLHDAEVLRFLLESDARYIGMLGPRGRTDDMLGTLRKDGFTATPEQLSRLYAPVGLDIGAETPEEIALAALAEIRAVIAGRPGRHLRERIGCIHRLETHHIGAIILAAGASRRLGEPKQLLQIEGQTLLRRTVDAALASRCEHVAVVIGAAPEQMREELAGLPVQIVENLEWQDGLSTSVRAGLAALEGTVDALLFIPCDQPALDGETLDALIAAHEKNGKPIVVSSYGEAWGAPMLVARKYWHELKSLEGDRGAQPIAYRHTGEVETVAFPEGACDIDTRADYEALLKAAQTSLQPITP
jgi:xanthine/CO dehydrogenase XdhC/CoxF family maturation factor/CTP:molybdopterin cytidylyltransferase MocA